MDDLSYYIKRMIMITYIFLRPEEINKPLIIRPLPEQPPEGYNLKFVDSISRNLHFIGHDGKGYWGCPIPYTSKLVVKETWRIISFEKTTDLIFHGLFASGYNLTIEYKAGGQRIIFLKNGQWEKYILDLHYWRSPVTMPSAFSRYTIKVKFDVKRVQELSLQELQNLNIAHGWKPLDAERGHKLAKVIMNGGLKNNWNSRYANKGYLWESNPYVLLMKAEWIKT